MRIPACLVVLSCSLVGCVQPDPLRHDDRLHAWLEFTDVDRVETHVEWAATLNLDLRVAVVQGRHDANYARTVCAAAEAHDVGLSLWPLLDEADGYWPNQSNATQFATWATELAALQTDGCPRLDAVVVDMEMPIDRSETLTDTTLTVSQRLTALSSSVDLGAFEAARSTYSDLVDSLHERDLRVFLTTLPMLVDDQLDGDEGIAQALWTPVEGVAWDRLSFQVYRTLFDEYARSLLGTEEPFGAGLVTSYAADIELYWPDTGSLDLGTTGEGMVEHDGMEEPAELQADIAAGLDAGVPLEAINVYSLEGLLEHDDPAAWVGTPEPRAALVAPEVDEIRAVVQGLDELL